MHLKNTSYNLKSMLRLKDLFLASQFIRDRDACEKAAPVMRVPFRKSELIFSVPPQNNMQFPHLAVFQCILLLWRQASDIGEGFG